MPVCDKCGMRYVKGQKAKHNKICPEKTEKNYAEQDSDMAEELIEEIQEEDILQDTDEEEESLVGFSIEFLLPPDDHFRQEICEIIQGMAERNIEATECPSCNCSSYQKIRGTSPTCLEYTCGICGFMYTRRTDVGQYIFE